MTEIDKYLNNKSFDIFLVVDCDYENNRITLRNPGNNEFDVDFNSILRDILREDAGPLAKELAAYIENNLPEYLVWYKNLKIMCKL